MEEGTALVLALQLLALAAIAAALLLYLLCRLRPPTAAVAALPVIASSAGGVGGGRAVLVTHADSALGLQIALRLADRGFRVFAGLKDPSGSGAAAAACRAWAKRREGLQEIEAAGGDADEGDVGWLQALRLDACREDQLHEAAGAVRGRLPAAEDGLWAVVHVGGTCGGRGRLETQESAQWERLLRENVVGALRAARALTPLLRSQKGRLLLLGDWTGAVQKPAAGAAGAGLVAFGAARAAVEGAAVALRAECAPVRVVTLRPHRAIAPEALFAPPRWSEPSPAAEADAASLEAGAVAAGAVECRVLGEAALRAVEEALLSERPKDAYALPAADAPKGLCGARALHAIANAMRRSH